MPSRPRLDYGQLRQEPAISGLDWLFTPIPRLEEHLSIAPLQASTTYYCRFTLPRNRSTGFGSQTSDSWRFHTTPLASCGFLLSLWVRPCYGLTLATHLHSLVRYSKRTAHTPKSAYPTIANRFQRLFNPC